MKKLSGLFAVGSALFLGGIAQAQPGEPMMPGAMPPTATVTTTTTTDTGAIPTEVPMESGTMPSTGGAPIAMALSGILAAGGAFLARRKLA